jgi:DNA-directed RNA polymerase specialized sigma24 family protein
VRGPRRRRWRLVIARAPLGWGRPRVRSPPARRRPLVPARAERHVDDVVQATWLRLREDIRRLREPAAVAGWLETTTRRNAMRHLYGRNRESSAAIRGSAIGRTRAVRRGRRRRRGDAHEPQVGVREV